MVSTKRLRIGPVVALVIIAGCSSPHPGHSTASTTIPAATTTPDSPTVATTAVSSTVAAPRITPPAPTTTTTKPLSRNQASTKLCQIINSANKAVLNGRYVAAALQLGGGISNYGAIADPALTAASKTMLSAGVHGNPDGYNAALQNTVPICAALGQPIAVGPIQCLVAPCPGTSPRAAAKSA
jgi:hypothetical protein